MDFNDDENIEWLMESSKTVENVVENDLDFELREQESLELCNFLQVLRSAFENEPTLVDSTAKGTIRSEEDMQKLIKRLKALGYFFSVRSSDRKSDKRNCKLLIVNKKNPPSSHPYRIVSRSRYYCSYRCKQEQRSEPTEPVQEPKKKNSCKAIMDIRQVEVFTNISLPTSKKKRIEILKKFRRSLAIDPVQVPENKFIVAISLPGMHNHSREVKGQYLNDEVKAAMHCILRSGVKSVEEIQRKLYRIVDKDFENDAVKPSRGNPAFYPNRKVIYNHLRHDGLVGKRLVKKNRVKITDLKLKIEEELMTISDNVNECQECETLGKVLEMLRDVKKLLPDEVS